MKGRFVVSSSLLAALLSVAAGVGGSGCSSSSSGTDLETEGPLRLKQVFVNSRGGNGLPFRDPAFLGAGPDFIDGGDLAWGLQADIGFCNFDDTCPTDTFPAGYTCNAAKLCVDANGKQVGIQDAIIASTDAGFPVFELVFKELVKGDTVVTFDCSCTVVLLPNGNVGPGNCGTSGPTNSRDSACGDCPDNADTTTVDESGQCRDINGDDVPDTPRLIPDIVTISCDNMPTDFTNGPNDGFYDATGNQFVPIDVGFEGLGPRIYLFPSGPFPANSDCQLTVASSVTDKDGLAIELDSSDPIVWHTEDCDTLGSSPEDGEEGVDSTSLGEITVTYNTELEAPAAAAITVMAGAAAVPGTTTLSEDDPTTLIWTPDSGTFDADTTYTVTVAGGTATNAVSDTFGQACLAQTITFVTAAAALMSLPQ